MTCWEEKPNQSKILNGRDCINALKTSLEGSSLNADPAKNVLAFATYSVKCIQLQMAPCKWAPALYSVGSKKAVCVAAKDVGKMVPIDSAEWSLCKGLYLEHIKQCPNPPQGYECYCLPRTAFQPLGCPHNKVEIWKKANYKKMACPECSTCLRCGKFLTCNSITAIVQNVILRQHVCTLKGLNTYFIHCH